MKKINSFLLALFLAISLTACGNRASTDTQASSQTVETANPKSSESVTEPETEPEDTESTASEAIEETIEPSGTSGNVLVVYFSVPEDVSTDGVDAIASASIVVDNGEILGNTQYIANIIRERTGADLFRIDPETPYPTDHDPLVDFAAEEQDDNARPAIANHIENLDAYDTVFIGYPNWWGDMPQILYTFLDEYDLSGKTVVPFCTHGGSGFSRTISTITEMEPNANVIQDGYTVSRDSILEADSDVIDWLQGLGY